MQLYKLTENYQQIQDIIDNADELDEELLIDTWESIDEAFEDKVTATAYVIKNNEADIEVIDAEIKRLQARKRTKKNATTRLKDYIKDNMIKTDKQKIEGDLFTVSVRNNAQSVKITDEEKLPDVYFKVKREPNKTLIKDRLKNGEKVDGAELQRTQSLNIR